MGAEVFLAGPFVIFLPPLPYSAGVFADLRSLRDNLRPILLLSTGSSASSTSRNRGSRSS